MSRVGAILGFRRIPIAFETQRNKAYGSVKCDSILSRPVRVRVRGGKREEANQYIERSH